MQYIFVGDTDIGAIAFTVLLAPGAPSYGRITLIVASIVLMSTRDRGEIYADAAFCSIRPDSRDFWTRRRRSML